eukprot:TRINITY_DN73892_c0_g1_i1.p1 TRINITY_DN73892_c0_g1~~TRINITY_DN73892_c0_g1_i1.p1  ORF type:complete len:526 (-),score=94.47 TRINITY_DN73892_c0_g1_i1:72-1649(-)
MDVCEGDHVCIWRGSVRGGLGERLRGGIALILCRLHLRLIAASTIVFLHCHVATSVDVPAELRTSLALHPGDASVHAAVALSHHRNNDLDAAEKGYLTALRLNPAIAEVQTDLGVLLFTRNRKSEAEVRLKAAIELDPELTTARVNLARLQYSRATEEGDALQIEAALRELIKLDPSEAGWNSDRSILASKLVERGAKEEAMAVIRTAANLLERQGRSPTSLIINFAALKEGGWQDTLLREQRAFSIICGRGEERGIANSRELPAALAALRELESSGDWVAEYYVERYSLFGSDEESAGYGATWFESFLTVAKSHEKVASALGGRDPVGSKLPRVFVAGSGLGEVCLFAAALGAHCVGFEVICDSMVGRVTSILEAHGLQEHVKLKCGDAAGREAMAVLAGGDRIDLVWINDFIWPNALKRRMWETLARSMRPGGLVVSFNDTTTFLPDDVSQLIKGAFVKLTTVWTEFSWSSKQPLDIWEKRATSAPSLPKPARALPAGRSCTEGADGSCPRLDEAILVSAVGS